MSVGPPPAGVPRHCLWFPTCSWGREGRPAFKAKGAHSQELRGGSGLTAESLNLEKLPPRTGRPAGGVRVCLRTVSWRFRTGAASAGVGPAAPGFLPGGDAPTTWRWGAVHGSSRLCVGSRTPPMGRDLCGDTGRPVPASSLDGAVGVVVCFLCFLLNQLKPLFC